MSSQHEALATRRQHWSEDWELWRGQWEPLQGIVTRPGGRRATEVPECTGSRGRRGAPWSGGVGVQALGPEGVFPSWQGPRRRICAPKAPEVRPFCVHPSVCSQANPGRRELSAQGLRWLRGTSGPLVTSLACALTAQGPVAQGPLAVGRKGRPLPGMQPVTLGPHGDGCPPLPTPAAALGPERLLPARTPSSPVWPQPHNQDR